MGYSKHKLSAINMLYSIKRHITPPPPQNGHFLVVVFYCNSGERSLKFEVEQLKNVRKLFVI